MAAKQLASLYQDLRRAFDAQPSDLTKCGILLLQLKVSSRRLGFSSLPYISSPRWVSLRQAYYFLKEKNGLMT